MLTQKVPYFLLAAIFSYAGVAAAEMTIDEHVPVRGYYALRPAPR